MAEKIATRESYGAALAALGEKHDFLVLDADLSKSTKTEVFKKKFPDRFYNCGIAEGNMMCVAAGIASTGKPVFASSFAMFASGRAFEQIRNCIGYPHLNVKIGATHAGITVGEDGATHQCNEDIAIMRTIPGMVIINPADANEALYATEAALLHDGPVYLRFGRYAVPNITADIPNYKFELGKGVKYTDGNDVTIVATGLMVAFAMEAAESLREEGINAEVINIHTIKPLDEKAVIESAAKTGAVVVAEEHFVAGGLGELISGVLAANKPAPVEYVAIKDKFGQSGTPSQLMKAYGLDAENIVAACKKAIGRK